MAKYHVGFAGKAGVNTANTPIFCLWSPARKTRVQEIGVFYQTTPSNVALFLLARTLTRGTGVTQSLTPIRHDTGDPVASCNFDIAWSGIPGYPGFNTVQPFVRTGAAPAAIGNGVLWTLDGLELEPGSGIALLNGVASGGSLGSYHGYAEFEE